MCACVCGWAVMCMQEYFNLCVPAAESTPPNSSHLKVEGKAGCHREECGDTTWFKNGADTALSDSFSWTTCIHKILLLYVHRNRQI